MDFFCSFFLKSEFFIKLSKDCSKVFVFNLFKITPLVIVSGSPPLLVIITAHPFPEASKLVLPKGSSHLEQATAMLVFLNIFITSACFLKPRTSAFLCFIFIFSLFSSPIIFAFQSGCLLRIL